MPAPSACSTFAAAASAKKLLLTSSGAVYGPQPAGLSHVPEDYTGAPDPLLPASVYGEGKRAAELMCSLAAGADLEIKIARCFAFIGPHLPLHAHFAAGNFLADALAGRNIKIASDGSSIRSYLYASDLAIWLWTMLFRAPSLRAYNVGSEDAVSIAELAETTARIVNPAIAIEIAQSPDPTRLPHRYVPSTARARTELGLASDRIARRGLAAHGGVAPAKIRPTNLGNPLPNRRPHARAARSLCRPAPRRSHRRSRALPDRGRLQHAVLRVCALRWLRHRLQSLAPQPR